MATPAVRETSVLVSLRELRAIEDDRTAEERAAAAREVEAQRRHERDLAEAHRAAEAARQDAIARAARVAAEAAAAAAREDALRLREAEIQAQAAAAAAVEAQRIAHDAQLRRLALERTRPRSLYAIVGVCAATLVALGVMLVSRDRELADRERRLQEVAIQREAAQLAVDRAIADRDSIAETLTEMRAAAAAAAAAAAVPVVPPPAIKPPPRPPVVHRPAAGSGATHGGTGGHIIDLRECARTPLGCME